MAQQDKIDWYWNGVLAGAINNLYYDLINVDVVPVPYATHHRNSSFFLKTRLAYSISRNWAEWEETSWFEVMDIKILWDDACDNHSGTVYVMWRRWQNKAIFKAPIEELNNTHIWCVGEFERCTQENILENVDCGNWKLFTTDFIKWEWVFKGETVATSQHILVKKTWTATTEVQWKWTWIQINKYIAWKSVWFFSDENVENWYAEFLTSSVDHNTAVKASSYILVYQSRNMDGDWHAWQVRMITGISNDGRIMVDEPWSWLRVSDDDDEEEWPGVSYAIFEERWEVVGFSNNKNINIIYDWDNCWYMSVYDQSGWAGWAKWKIIWVAEAAGKIFVLTKNGYVHYNKDWGWYDKFFINDDVLAWVDKISITSYRDIIVVFWRNRIAVWIPDDKNEYWSVYDQSQTLWLWSRYSFAEYDWDLIFVSNDKRLLRMWIASSVWRYMLQHEDSWYMLNGKLSVLRPWDEVFIWADNNNLRVFCNISSEPYYVKKRWHADISTTFNLSSTHIYKFDTLFQTWTEDHINWHLIKGATEGVYYWEDGIYIRDDATRDCTYTDSKWVVHWTWSQFNTYISAYVIENEADWVWGNSSWLASRPKLYSTAKLNRLITTLWPWVYSNNVKTKITTYSKWIWYTYEFPVSWDWNDWLWLMTSYYLEEELTDEEREKIQCMLSTLQDGQIEYQPNCSESDVKRQYIAQNSPWCEDYDELTSESHGICINDKLYEIAPTMPLVTNLWENQQYSTQIKIELIWWEWDIISFGWRLAEIFIAPLFTVGPDWEYQLQPNTDC